MNVTSETGLEPAYFHVLTVDAPASVLLARSWAHLSTVRLATPLAGAGLSSSGDDVHGGTVGTQPVSVNPYAPIPAM